MSADLATLTAQIADELDTRLTDQIAKLLGHDLRDLISGRIAAKAPTLASLITHTEEHIRWLTVTALMTTLWPTATPEESDEPEWWLTPLGRACARVLADENDESITQLVAARMLGITRGSVAQMVARGNLPRHEPGVSRSAILRRIGTVG